MLIPAQRAEQFIPKRSLKGLREALTEREEKHLREEKLMPDEESVIRLNGKLAKLKKGQHLNVQCYIGFRNTQKSGIITYLNFPSGFFILDKQKIFFNDIYSLEIIDF